MLVGCGALCACGGGGSGPADGGRDALASIDAAVDAPVTADLAPDAPPDAAPDVMPDLKPDLMPDLGIPCGDAGECTSPLACCGLCVDTHKDPRNCGGCGTRCTAMQFCTGTACSELSFANVCSNPNVTVIKDQYDTDNAAAARIASALMATCMPAPTVVEKDQSAEGVLDLEGRPMAGGSTTYVNGGGSFGQRLIDYLDKTGLTPLFLTGDATNVGFRNRLTGENVAWPLRSALTEGHDFFLVELTVEPQGGTLSVAAMGLLAPGTTAAAYWVSTEMIPKRAMYPDTWYVFEWTDNGDKLPGGADTFTMVAHGK